MRKKIRKIFEILTQHTSKVGSSTLKMGTEIKSNTYLVFFPCKVRFIFLIKIKVHKKRKF